jgi:hypothetical protein
MHKRADDPFFTETRNGVITARSAAVVISSGFQPMPEPIRLVRLPCVLPFL